VPSDASPAAAPPALPEPSGMVSRCPGCGAVLAAGPGLEVRHEGASPACTRLFDVTVRGLRDEAPSDLRAAGVLELAEATYDAQHPLGDDAAALARLRQLLGDGSAASAVRPEQWTTTVADVAADLDVVDLPALVRSWSAAVVGDWTGVTTRR